MEDPDAILYLFPHKGEGFDGAAFATSMPRNKSRYLAARYPDALKQHNISCRQDRAETELPVERGVLENTDCLVLRFSHGARSSVGVVGGCGTNADLTFQNIPGISTFHLAFTFDDQNRPIVRDLGSRGGTKVTYNGEKGERVSNFDWLLQGPSIAEGKPPILNITDAVQFKVIVPLRDITSPDYINRVKKFRLGTADPEDLLRSFILQSGPGTRLPTGQQTPLTGSGSRPILYQKRLGTGAFGIVQYVWNVTTADEYVVKQPLRKLVKKNRFDVQSWVNEAAIMGSISHPQIVIFRNATFSPWPKLEFEYVRGGSLDTYDNLSTFESTQVLCQLSSALEYLHNQTPSIGHRDIKPENILVVDRDVKGIYVKFADFGLSKAADSLKTFCGTLLWAAPEIYLKAADRKGTANNTYSVAVDIWSLGVVVASIECGGLPVYEEGWETDAEAWINAIQSHVTHHWQIQHNELLWFLLDNMLVEDPEERSSADYCHDEARTLLKRISDTRHQESDDQDKSVTTPKPSMHDATCTVRPDIQLVSSKSLEATFKRTVQVMYDDSGQLTDCHCVVNEGEWSEVLSTQPSQVSATSVAMPQASMVDGLLWRHESLGEASRRSSNEAEAIGADVGEAQMKGPSQKRHSKPFCEVQGDVVRKGGKHATSDTEEPRQMRKRMWLADTRPAASMPQSFKHVRSGASDLLHADPESTHQTAARTGRSQTRPED